MRPRGTTRALRRRARSSRAWAPVILGLVALAGVSIVVMALGSASLRSSTQGRIADRISLLERFNAAGPETYDEELMIDRSSQLPFSPTDRRLNEALLGLLSLSPTGDPYVATLVLDAGGTVLGANPPEVSIDLEVLGDAIEATLSGYVGLSPSFELGGELVWARTIPLGAPSAWGLLVTIEPLGSSWVQRLYEALGPVGPGDGGFILLDSNGTAVAAWDPALLGGQPVSPAELASLSATPEVWSVERSGERVTRIGSTLSGPNVAPAHVFEQPEASLLGDLRQVQAQHDRVVLAMTAGSILVIALFALVRETSVLASRRRVETILANVGDVLAIVDGEDRLGYVNQAIEVILGHPHQEMAGTPFEALVPGEHRERATAALAEARSDGGATLLGLPLRTVDDGTRWFDLVLSDRRGEPEIDGVLVTCREVGGRKRLEEELEHLAEHDALTGVANRARFDAVLAATASAEGPFALMLLDLDGFKELNDSLGHDVGDEALRLVTRRLQEAVRDGDLVARLGGDELGIILPEVEPEGITSLAARLLEAVEVALAGRLLRASAGVAWAVGPLHQPGEVVREADAAMYRAKRGGGAQVVISSTSPQVTGREPAPSTLAAPVRPAAASSAPAPRIEHLGGRQRATRGRLRALGPLLLAVVAVTALGAGTLVAAQRAQVAAEEQRLRDRGHLLQAVGDVSASMSDISKLVPIASATPWNPSSPLELGIALSVYSSALSVDEVATAALVDRGGSILGIHPRGASLPQTLLADRWDQVLAGTAYSPPLLSDGEVLRLWSLVPVISRGEVELVLVLGVSASDLGWSGALAALGSLGAAPGGISIVDSNGLAVASWDAGLIGTPLIEPERLQVAPAGDPAVWRDGGDGNGAESVTVAAPLSLATTDRYALWQQGAGDLFADLGHGRGLRDATLLALLLLTVVALSVVNHRRGRALEQHRSRLDSLLEWSHDLVLIIGRNGLISFASTASVPLLGRRPETLVGLPLAELVGTSGEELILGGISGGGGSVGDVRVSSEDGDELVFDITFGAVGAAPGIDGALLTLHDMTDRARLLEELRARVLHDPLTGLANRSQLSQRLEDLHRRGVGAPGSYAVLFIDLDHFKPVNDRYGHQVGDEVLREVSSRLRSAVRPSDVVCRLGGDEFVVLLSECEHAEAEETARRLLVLLHEPVETSDAVIRIAASVGVALSRSDLAHPEHLIREADEAMYQAKRSGRSRFVSPASADRTREPAKPRQDDG